MNKTAIRNYAVWARTALIEAVTQKAFEYEIKGGAEMNGSLESIGGRLLTSDDKEWRKKLIDEIKHITRMIYINVNICRTLTKSVAE